MFRLHPFAPLLNLKEPEIISHPIVVSSKLWKFIRPTLGVITIFSGIY
jgi:hypothetical protein